MKIWDRYLHSAPLVANFCLHMYDLLYEKGPDVRNETSFRVDAFSYLHRAYQKEARQFIIQS